MRVFDNIFGKHLPVLSASMIIFIFSIAYVNPVASLTSGWSDGQIRVIQDESLSTVASNYGLYGQCKNETIKVQDYYANYISRDECVYDGTSFKYILSSDTGELMVDLEGNHHMYPLRGLSFGARTNIRPSPNTNDFIFGVSIIKDLPNKIQLKESNSKLFYELLSDVPLVLGNDENGYQHNSNVSAVSRNGQWMVVNFQDLGFVRFNLSDFSAKWIGKFRSFNEFMAVSNDGNSIAVSPLGGYATPLLYDVTNCGRDSRSLSSTWFTQALENECTKTELSPIISEALDTDFVYSNSIPEFNESGDELILLVETRTGGSKGVRLIKSTPNERTNEYDYLALGDSYSSGRGDIGVGPNGQSYYTSASRGPKGCHISTRSFPFQLKRFNNVADDRMRSVACAGARLNNDFYGPNDNYFGQSDQLKTKNATEVSQMRKLAIDEFLPGIVKQLEFVKTTKPKVVTVTAGGNDVGFADIILSCITSPGISHRMSTCDEATAGSFKSNLVGDAIQSQFKLTKQLIAELKSISPTTTTYVVGYPKFIADDAKRCLNTMMLNQHEMKAINAAVSYMNRVLASAAKAGGARFIDIENSLVGGRLCEGGEYMTGLLNFSLDTDFSEMFHPNSEGHIRMADSIQASGFAISEDNNPVAIDASVPTKPAAFGTTSYVPTFAQKLLPEAMIVAGGAHPLLIAADGIFNNADTVTFTLHSNPVKLGTFTAQADGSMKATISVPRKTDPGVHMLVADVVSSDGSKKRYFQYIEVKSSRVDDRDGDGILDSVDSCLYVKYWYDEQSGKDVCTPVTSESMPGRGFGHGYGHLISNGLHTGHGGHTSSLVP